MRHTAKPDLNSLTQKTTILPITSFKLKLNTIALIYRMFMPRATIKYKGLGEVKAVLKNTD